MTPALAAFYRLRDHCADCPRCAEVIHARGDPDALCLFGQVLLKRLQRASPRPRTAPVAGLFRAMGEREPRAAAAAALADQDPHHW